MHGVVLCVSFLSFKKICYYLAVMFYTKVEKYFKNNYCRLLRKQNKSIDFQFNKKEYLSC